MVVVSDLKPGVSGEISAQRKGKESKGEKIKV